MSTLSCKSWLVGAQAEILCFDEARRFVQMNRRFILGADFQLDAPRAGIAPDQRAGAFGVAASAGGLGARRALAHLEDLNGAHQRAGAHLDEDHLEAAWNLRRAREQGLGRRDEIGKMAATVQVFKDDAVRMLGLIQGRAHEVHTGLCLMRQGTGPHADAEVHAFVDTAHVVRMVMCDQDGSERQPFVGQVAQHRCCIAWVNNRGGGAMAKQPDIVIAKRGKRDNLHPLILVVS